VWSHAAGKVVEKFASLMKGKRVVAQFHEWLSAAGLLYLKKQECPIGTVFTTHATTLGRTLAFHNIDFYSRFKEINPDEKAVQLQVREKHQIEKQAALQATIFTTVSEITGLEAEHFLGRKPEVILPNGLDANQFLNFEEIAWKHQIHRNRLREFLFSYFFPYYTFDLEQTLFYFIASRYEFRAKGIGLFINALASLNKKLVQTKSKKTIVVFFWVPSQVKQINPELLENRELYQDVRDYLEETANETKEHLLYTIMEGKHVHEKNIFHEDALFEIKKRILKFKKEGTPPLSTHYLTNPQDQILRAFVEAGLDNKKSDRVKVIFYPVYLNGHDGLTNLNYFESIQASHFGIFPSLYEPWGYTPLETAAFGVASLTLTLSGFGQFCYPFVKGKNSPGIFVLDGFDKSDKTLVEEMSDVLYRFYNFFNVLRCQTNRPGINSGEFFEEHRLAFHHRKRCVRP
jgi:glycogen(starch) synthase